MNGSAGVLKRLDDSTREIQQIIRSYSDTHGVQVWYWEQSRGKWVCSAGTGEAPADEPGPGALEIPTTGLKARVEVSDNDAERAAFLVQILGRLLHHQARSRAFGREIAERYEEITLLYTISEILGSVISLEESADTILAEVTDTMAVRRAALWIHDPETDRLDLIASVGTEGQVGPIDVADESSITAAVFRNRRAMVLEPGAVYPREDLLVEGANRDSFLSVPLSYTPPHGQPRTIGVINLIGRTVAENFSAGDQKLITAIASQIAAAVENRRLVSESLVQERMVREMELAHDLQLKLLPSTSQFRDYADVAARCSPADSVGGDFYHLFRLPGGRFGVMIGDVSSHGFAAALIMALTMSAVAIHASEGDPPAEVLRRVHRALIDELETTEMYLTLFYGVIDPLSGTLSFANAGHAHAFRIDGDGEVERLPSTNPPFGLVDLDDYGEKTIDWRAGTDLLFLFTDGLSDAISPSSGEQKLVELVARERGRSVEELVESLFALDGGVGEAPSDDRTAVLVRI
jgi:phosphoserine phosphatase RsbU/P